MKQRLNAEFDLIMISLLISLLVWIYLFDTFYYNFIAYYIGDFLTYIFYLFLSCYKTLIGISVYFSAYSKKITNNNKFDKFIFIGLILILI